MPDIFDRVLPLNLIANTVIFYVAARSSAPATRRQLEINHGRSKRARMKIGMQAYRLARSTPLAILLSDPLALRAKSTARAGLKHRSRQTSRRFVCRMFARARRLAAR